MSGGIDDWVDTTLAGVIPGRTSVTELHRLLGQPVDQYPHGLGTTMHVYHGASLPAGPALDRYFLSEGSVVVGLRLEVTPGQDSSPDIAKFRKTLDATATSIADAGGLAIQFDCEVGSQPGVGLVVVWAPNGMIGEFSLGPPSRWLFPGNTCVNGATPTAPGPR